MTKPLLKICYPIRVLTTGRKVSFSICCQSVMLRSVMSWKNCSRVDVPVPTFCMGQRFNSMKSTTGYDIQKTTINFQNYDPRKIDTKDLPPFITRYSTRGFTIQGNKVMGPVALLPKAFYAWKIYSAKDITPESLQLFTVMDPPIEILVIGCGDRVVPLSAEVKQYLSRHRIAIELLDTPNACATFNFLTEEQRVAAAVLLPPEVIPV